MKGKRLIAAALLLCICLGLTACGAKYADDVPMSRFISRIDAHMGKDLAEMNSGYLSGAMHLDPSSFASYVVKSSTKGTFDEYGVFRAPDSKSVNSVKDAVEGYLNSLRNNKQKIEYMPEEKPKLDKAEVKVYGIYVLYVIADDDVREAVYQEVETLLKK